MMKSVFGFALVAASLTSVAGARAEGMDMQKYLTLGEMQVTEVQVQDTQGVGPFGSKELAPAPQGEPVEPSEGFEDWLTPENLDLTNLILDKIINMGKKVWTLVEANKPVVNVQLNTANALPANLPSWQSLGGWQTPVSKVYRVSYKNMYGMNVVDFSYRILYTYGGNAKGKGRYLTHVTLVPHQLDVAWGFTFNAEAKIPSVVNAGTSEDPVGAMELMLSWKVNTVMKHSESTASYFVRGDGQFVDLTNGN